MAATGVPAVPDAGGWGGAQVLAQQYGQTGVPARQYAQPGYAQGFDFQGFGVPGAGQQAQGPRSKRRRPLIIVFGAVVIVVAVVASLFGLGVLTPASIGLPLGSGTATITWPSAPSAPPDIKTGILPRSAFSGVIAGKPASGTGGVSGQLFGILFGGLDNAAANITFFTVSGTLGNTRYAIDVTVPKTEFSKLNSSGSLPPGTMVTLDVSGTYGKYAIRGTLSGDGNSNVRPVHFDVTIGPVRATGTITVDSGSNRATATYSLS